ncbi:uncharacterized protein LOC132707961 isoform X5 [Cylas formicarius]|uniref:uncharacterized protein LOC132707961 isoform X5 n=1 Tax=Cylas formicarius TaxID=197179 RepID=UPI00295882E2|nr:uncharacterized protein LOC132707961 isoform X5 [Cylas formicarius]
MVLLFWFIFWLLVVFLMYVYIQWRLKAVGRHAPYFRITRFAVLPQQHGQHIFNISGRVPEQHHCTPDAYLTVEHINVTNQMNKPSCYNDEPPSYEDAIKMVQGGTAHAPATQQPHSAAAIPAVHRLSV